MWILKRSKCTFSVTNICKWYINKCRLCSSTTSKDQSYFVTTPIFYVNSSPHIGHLYSALIADAAHRFKKLTGIENTIFSVGTDEHGLKIQQAATNASKNPQSFCDEISSTFKSLFDKFDIQHTDFIRTTELRHKLAVERFYNSIESNGFIYKDNYESWYCVADETFLTQSQVKNVENEKYVSLESGHPAEWQSEPNYIFKLSSFENDLLYWLKEDRVTPSYFQEELKCFISSGLHDLSISRPQSRVNWGIPLPADPNHTLYVWVDALINYLTVANYPDLMMWPPDVQIIGKDILRFHGIYWPALLIAAGLEPPRKLAVHCHWLNNGVKMSKSLGNVVSPFNLSHLSSDGLRYCLLSTGTPHSDGTWNEELAIRNVNSALANTFGNLISRCMSKSLNRFNSFPPLHDTNSFKSSDLYQTILDKIKYLPDIVEKHYLDYNFYKGIDEIMDLLRLTNNFINQEEPWKMQKQADSSVLDSVIHIGLLSSVAASLALQPIIPTVCDSSLAMLGVPRNKRSWTHLKGLNSLTFSGEKLEQKTPIFKRI